MSSKSEARVALQEFIKDVGIPNEMVCDGAGEQVGPKSDFIKACRRVHYKMRRTEPHSPWQNQAEGMIGETKRQRKTKTSAKNVPGRVWDYGLVHESTIMSHITRGPDGRTGYERMTGYTPDISEMLDFDIWNLIWYHQPGTDTSEPVRRLGRWLGIAHRIGSDMCYWVIPVSGVVLACITVQRISTPLELQVTELQDQVKEFDIALRERLSDSNFVISGMEETSGFYVPDIYDMEEFADSVTVPRDRDGTQPEQDLFTPKGYDNMINAKIMIPKSDSTIVGKVIKRAKGED
jgi:hypothetical protein